MDIPDSSYTECTGTSSLISDVEDVELSSGESTPSGTKPLLSVKLSPNGIVDLLSFS